MSRSRTCPICKADVCPNAPNISAATSEDRVPLLDDIENEPSVVITVDYEETDSGDAGSEGEGSDGPMTGRVPRVAHTVNGRDGPDSCAEIGIDQYQADSSPSPPNSSSHGDSFALSK